MAWKGIVGLSLGPREFDQYCRSLNWKEWRPAFVVLHNTGVPSLAQRPDGFTLQHMRALESYYRDTQHWTGGPHLFVDDRQVWVFTPPTLPGTHSPSWNRVSLGIEMLGDYAIEPFDAGRGALVRDNTVAAIAALSATLGLAASILRLHKEDKATNHDCPGRNVDKEDVIRRVSAAMSGLLAASSGL